MGTLEWQIVREVAVAMLLGGVIGLDREAASKPAGIRTHMLVAGSAALLVGMGFLLVLESVKVPASAEIIAADPIRIIQAVVIGVSFLGTGTIFRERGAQGDTVQGLTTAASLLMASGIGIAVALKQIGLAAAVTVLVAVVLRVIGAVESWARRRPSR